MPKEAIEQFNPRMVLFPFFSFSSLADEAYPRDASCGFSSFAYSMYVELMNE
jgi:hypothetical protein